MSSQNKAIIDLLLTQTSQMYVPKGYISENLFPYIGVKNSTGKLAKYGNNHLRIENSVKVGRGKYRQVEPISRSTDSYSIEGHGLEGMVTADDYRNVIQPFQAENDEVLGITTMLWVEKEKVLADSLADIAVITQNTTLAGAQQYSDYNNSDPIADFLAARKAVKNGCGMPANVCFMDYDVAQTLRFHPQLRDLFKFTEKSAPLGDEQLARALGVEKILIANAMYNSAKEGQADSLANIWGKHLWFAVLPDSAQPYQISLGYRLGFSDVSARQVYKNNNFNPPNSTAILVEDNYDFLISKATAAYLIKNAIA